MTNLILCSLANEETQDFLNTERSLLDEIIAQKELSNANIHTLRLTELPDSSDKEKINKLGQELLGAFDLGTQDFQTEFLNRNEFTFLAIYGSEIKPKSATNAPAPKTGPRSRAFRLLWQVPAIFVGVVAILALLYYGIGFILTRQVETRYAGRECEGVVELTGSLEKVYPIKFAPFIEPALEQAEECRTYLAAEDLYKQKDWGKAYDAYMNYTAAYPNGIFAKESVELAADSMFAVASEQRSKKEYANAVDSLLILMTDFKGTSSMSKAKEALPDVYLEWGDEQRDKGEYSVAESVYQSLNKWANKENEKAYVTQAQVELASTYFIWGKALQGSNYFSLAATKFDEAISADPNAEDTNSLAAQVHAYLPGFHRAWGEYLIIDNRYSEAITHYKMSVDLSSSKDVENAKDTLTQAYLVWVDSLRKDEDYHQALDKVELARDTAVTDTTQAKVVSAYETTLSQFSHSTGTQAQEIISDVATNICKDGKPADVLPIVGVLDEKRLVVTGLKLSLPTDVLSQTTGNLYFVACAEEKNVTIQTCPYSLTGYGTVTHWIERVRIEWTFKVYDSLSGKLYKEKTFRGGSPASCPSRHTFYGTTDYNYGAKPTLSTVVDWLASLLK